jgi:hypothetical protein
MKIKTRLDDSGMLESDEWFRMNHWLAELRDDGQAEPRDEGQAEPWHDGRADPREERPEPRDESPESRDESPVAVRDESHAEPWDDDRAEPQDEARTETEDEGRAWTQDDGRAEDRAESRAGPQDDGRTGTQNDGRAWSPRHSYLPQALAAADSLTARAETTARAVIGDQLRIPIMWCELGSCISWYAHPEALGEADARTRAISAGWCIDAVGLLVCPQCQQTAPGFRSPRPVALWNRAEAITKTVQMATAPSEDAIASAARELSHDRRRPEPTPEAAVGAPWELSHELSSQASSDNVAGNPPWEVSRDPGPPDDGRHPASPLQPGRHRKRFAARIMPASLQAR